MVTGRYDAGAPAIVSGMSMPGRHSQHATDSRGVSLLFMTPVRRLASTRGSVACFVACLLAAHCFGLSEVVR